MERYKREIIRRIKNLLQDSEDSPFFNYRKNLLIDKTKYLDAFIDGEPFPPFEIEIQPSSFCNLKCKWCIGDKVQENSQIKNLPNHINENNIDKIIDNIINLRVNNLGVEIVKFAGFIGEPLFNKKTTLRGMQRLKNSGIRVGLFTNGVLMGEDTWNILSDIDYVHVSLDAGRASFFWLKEVGTYTEKTFDKIIYNIEGLNNTRKKDSKLKINIGYIVVPENHDQIFEVSELVKQKGADSIRFKCDIGDRYILTPEMMEVVFRDIKRVEEELSDDSFTVHSIHSKEDIEREKHRDWNRRDGCFYCNFVSTIGSNGCVYLCDHNTLPEGMPLGNIVNRPLEDIWKNRCREYFTSNIYCSCLSNVCPPFGNKLNFFLREIDILVEEYGSGIVKSAVDEIRSEI